jgi:hypothetical protein
VNAYTIWLDASFYFAIPAAVSIKLLVRELAECTRQLSSTPYISTAAFVPKLATYKDVRPTRLRRQNIRTAATIVTVRGKTDVRGAILPSEQNFPQGPFHEEML